MTTVGLLHPGMMGASVGAAARTGGARVLWASEGRSDGTRRRAAWVGLDDAGSLAALVRASDMVLAICPPHAAIEIARAVAGHRFRGIYVDGNAVAPSTARAIAGIVEAAGATFVDGSIVGPPPDQPGTTRLYLSGDRADEVRSLFAHGPLEPVVLPGPLTGASALKMADSAWRKGSRALLLSVRALASAEGVDEALVAEWNRSQPGLPERSKSELKGIAGRIERWGGEMDEVATAFGGAGLPDGFHRAAGVVYRRIADHGAMSATRSLEDVTRALLENSGRASARSE